MDLNWQGCLVHVSQVFILCNKGEDWGGGGMLKDNACQWRIARPAEIGTPDEMHWSLCQKQLLNKSSLGKAREYAQHFFCICLFNFG